MTEKKKGIPPLAIVGVGCLVVLIAGGIGLSILLKKGAEFVGDLATNPSKVAELAVKSDPNLEFVASDDAKGTITFRDKRTGKETTIDWEQIKDGRITVTTGDETATVDAAAGEVVVESEEGTSTYGVGGVEKLPDWVEVPEGIENWKSAAHAERADGQISGMVVGDSGRPVAELVDAFEESLAAAGFTRQSKTEVPDRVVMGFKDESKKRVVTVSVFRQDGRTGVSLGYEQR